MILSINNSLILSLFLILSHLVITNSAVAFDEESISRAIKNCSFPEVPNFKNTNEIQAYWFQRKKHFKDELMRNYRQKYELEGKQTTIELLEEGIDDEMNNLMLFPDLTKPLHEQKEAAIQLEIKLSKLEEELQDLPALLNAKTKKEIALEEANAKKAKKIEERSRKAKKKREEEQISDTIDHNNELYIFNMSRFDNAKIKTQEFPPTSTDLSQPFQMTTLIKPSSLEKMNKNIAVQNGSMVSKGKYTDEVKQKLVNDIIEEVNFDIKDFYFHYKNNGGNIISPTDLARIDNEYRKFIVNKIRLKFPNSSSNIINLFERTLSPSDDYIFFTQRELYKELHWIENAPELASQKIAEHLERKLAADLLEFFTFTRVNPTARFNIKPSEIFNSGQLARTPITPNERILLNSEKDYMYISKQNLIIGEVKSFTGGSSEVLNKILRQIRKNGELANFVIRNDFAQTAEMRLHFPFGLYDEMNIRQMYEAAEEAGIKLVIEYK
ncbi:hypothetical protein N9N67_01490 [Bacteriovoracaceae bacterium]|nr:hypothetical protein [Bacteriovoracaceae bacterium]